MLVKISKMSGKLEDIPAINTNTLSNPFCIKMNNSKNENIICTKCYSVEMLETFRKNCVPAFEHNSKVLREAVIPERYLPFINSAVFRFSGHGELINYTHLINLMNISLKNKMTTFTLWTKRKNLVNRYIKEYGKPNNLILVYSNQIINSIAKLPENFDKTFNNVSIDDDRVNCFQKCKDCLLCYTKNNTETIIEKVK
tara:strand:+ start:63 stop:656 length:594 start_codon:yes stop_codon:yes gene_type:complete